MGRGTWVEELSRRGRLRGKVRWRRQVGALITSIGPLPRVLCKACTGDLKVSGPTSLILSKIAV